MRCLTQAGVRVSTLWNWQMLQIRDLEIVLKYLLLWHCIWPSNCSPRKMKICVHPNTYILMFIVALFIFAPKWKQTKCLSIGVQNQ